MCARKTFYIFVNAVGRAELLRRPAGPADPADDRRRSLTYVSCIDTTRDKPFGFDLDRAHDAMRRGSVYFYRRELMFRRTNFLLEAA